jgi:hypothetical protein
MKTHAISRLLVVSCALFALAAALPGSAHATLPFSLFTRSDQAVGFQSTRVAVDLNRDGVPDLAATNFGSGVSVFVGNGDGTFGPPLTVATGAGASWAAAGDLNGDTIPDLVVANQSANTVSALLGLGNGAFQPAIATEM